MPAKVKPKTGGAVLDDSQPQISDAQATDLGSDSTGFVALPSAPGPSGPSYGMGGEVTQPSDFAREVAASTNVPSKGGPPVEDLYASSGKGPVGKLKKPSQATGTTKAPEDKTPPSIDTSKWPSIPITALAPAATSTPTPTAAPTPTPTPDTAAAAPSPSTAPGEPPDPGSAKTPEEYTARLPAFQSHADVIAKYAQRYQSGDQDYRRLDPYTTMDENFAGTDQGEPIFMDPRDNRVYYRDDVGLDKEVRHYFGLPAGSKDSSVTVEKAKAAMSRDAQSRMLALLQTKDAIDDWRTELQKFKDLNPGGEDAIQRIGLQTLLSGATDPVSNAMRTVAQMIQGPPGLGPGLNITRPMKDLDAARARIAFEYSQAASKNLPTSEAIRTSLNLPLTADDFDTQNSRVDGIEKGIADEARTLQVMYPYGNKQLEAILKRIAQTKGTTGQGAQQSAPAGSTARPAATPAPSPSAAPSQRKPTPEEAQAAPQINTPDDVKKYRSGTLVRDTDGKLKYVP